MGRKISGIKADTKVEVKHIEATKPRRNFYDDLVEKLVAKLNYAKANNISLGSALGYGSGRKGEDGYIVQYVDGQPANFSTNNQYTGRNHDKFLMAVALNDYDSGWFGTFNQWKQAGCMVKKGEKSVAGMRWLELTDEQLAANEKARMAGQEEPYSEYERPAFYYVFNINQVEPTSDEGKALLETLKTKRTSEIKVHYHVVDPISGTDAFGKPWFVIPQLEEIELDGVEIVKDGITVPDFLGLGTTKVACYNPVTHTINIPYMIKHFKSSSHYYKTLLHELAHSTAKALGRPLSIEKKSAAYANEELIAELSAWLLSVQFGLLPVDEQQSVSASYIDSWLKCLKADPDYLKEVMDEVTKVCRKIMGAVQPKK